MGFGAEDAETVKYVTWLTMGRSGMAGLEQYSPDTKEWTQAHARARFVLLQVSNFTYYAGQKKWSKVACVVVLIALPLATFGHQSPNV